MIKEKIKLNKWLFFCCKHPSSLPCRSSKEAKRKSREGGDVHSLTSSKHFRRLTSYLPASWHTFLFLLNQLAQGGKKKWMWLSFSGEMRGIANYCDFLSPFSRIIFITYGIMLLLLHASHQWIHYRRVQPLFQEHAFPLFHQKNEHKILRNWKATWDCWGSEEACSSIALNELCIVKIVVITWLMTLWWPTSV